MRAFNSADFADFQVDSSGNILEAGNYEGSLPGYTNAGNGDMILVSRSSSDPSSVSWSVLMGGTDYDVASCAPKAGLVGEFWELMSQI